MAGNVRVDMEGTQMRVGCTTMYMNQNAEPKNMVGGMSHTRTM